MIRGTKQAFYFYDLVDVASKMPRYMSHFRAGGQAIVVGSYFDVCGGTDCPRARNQFALLFPDGNRISWYDDDDLLTLVGPGRVDLAEEWQGGAV